MCMGTTRGDSQIMPYSLSGLYRQKHRATQEKKSEFWEVTVSVIVRQKKSSHENVCNAIKRSGI